MSGVTLALDAALGAGTIAVFDGERLVATREVPMGARSGDLFFPAVLEALAEASTRLSLVTRVVSGAGPGSFTSLRIAAAIAKGVAEGAGATLLAVPSLALAVAADQALPSGTYLVTSDALRGERFAQACERRRSGDVVTGAVRRLSPEDVTAWASTLGATVLAVAEGAPHAPHARGALRVLAGGLEATVDVAAWEPAYGRLAEAQVQWEAAHGRPLPSA
ncbi:MAG: tRNA (adenosine(37)-N6)-threonylcarbamoyltransferase complex dimerization subunit type 1 TsaB [Gemmatimonadetes bacterium]|nr:tRNA (adenosine(37)-N6)-threonylcarbamoyltransferase complex dimerization subunit type 1 TsaB [Gemmatimonadota bacterium]